MWKCPKCKQEFEKTRQQHYCNDIPKTIDDYINLQPEGIRPLLNTIKNVIHDTIPEAEEKISWRMPTYYKNSNIIHFAAFKNHIGLYPGDEAIKHFASELVNYKTSKGAIQIPYNSELPIELIIKITRWCYENYTHH